MSTKIHGSYVKSLLLTIGGILLLLLGVAAGIYLIGQQQEVREKAASPSPSQYPSEQLRY